jgi:hypothetical protein
MQAEGYRYSDCIGKSPVKQASMADGHGKGMVTNHG